MKYLVTLFAILFSGLLLANPINDKCPQFVVWGAPQVNVEGNNQYICRTAYALNYNYSTKVSYFVVERVTPAQIKGAVSRKNDFREDPSIPANHRSTLKDYASSGYDRGHMAPAANFASSELAMSESFFLSNMMPQAPGNNRGIWKYTEELTRKWVEKHGELFVITGTIYDNKGSAKIIGSGVHVPTHVYKIIIDPKTNRSISFMFPNIKLNVSDLENYIVTIAEIEKAAGINISPALPVNLSHIETTKSNLKEWQ